VPGQNRVALTVYDMLGREVATLVDKTLAPGVYTTQFDAGGLPSGVYYYRMIAGQFSQTKRLTLVK
jgi:hypothetical protein